MKSSLRESLIIRGAIAVLLGIFIALSVQAEDSSDRQRKELERLERQRVEQEYRRAEQERQNREKSEFERAERERQRIEQERQRAERERENYKQKHGLYPEHDPMKELRELDPDYLHDTSPQPGGSIRW